MNAWHFPTYTYVLVAATLIASAIAALTWPRRSAPGGTAFVLLMIATATWELFRILEALAVEQATKVLWAGLEYLGIATVPVLWFLFARQFARRDQASPGLGPIWLWIVPAATLMLALTNVHHGWFWTDIKPASPEPGANLIYVHGPAFWAAALYNYLLILIGTVALFEAILRGEGVDRRQAAYLLAGAMITWIANMVYLSGMSPVKGLDPTPFTFTLTGAIYAYTLFRYRLFERVPVSRRSLLESMVEGVLVIDNDARIADINTAAIRFLGLSAPSCKGGHAPSLLRKTPQLQQYWEAASEIQGETEIFGRNLDVRAVPLQEHGRKRQGLLLVLRDISKHRIAEEQLRDSNARLRAHMNEIEALQSRLQEQAIRDSLTGLFNRRYLEETLQREIAQAFRSGLPLGIVMIDIDHFKQLNDAHGHRAGDTALQALGQLLVANTRSGDVACRYGGEEFVLALPGATLEVARERAERVRRAIEEMRVDYGGITLTLTISAGIAAYPLHGERADEVLDHADQALYQAKSGGRNHCIVYGSDGTPAPERKDSAHPVANIAGR